MRLYFSGEWQVAAWEIVVPFLALVVIGYTLFRNAATRRAGERLMAEEDLATGTSAGTEGYR